MVKLKGPMMSAAASGPLGQSTSFSSWKGRAYAKKKTIPGDPGSPAQIGYRVMVAFLSTEWKKLSSADHATWVPRALETNVPPYSAFIAHNLDRWTQFRHPGQVDPVLEDDTLAANIFISATGHVGWAALVWNTFFPNDQWALAIHRTTTAAFTATRDNCVHLFPKTTSGLATYEDHDLQPATYYYQLQSFTKHGKPAIALPEKSCVVS